MKGFKKCPNGHWYKEELTACPYCPGGSVIPGNEATKVSEGNDNPTAILGQDMLNMTKTGSGNPTVIINNPNPQPFTPKPQNQPKPNSQNTNTIWIDEVETATAGGDVKIEKEYRTLRRLVGWLVTYSLDPLGVDFKIYEGRNVIGRDVNCNITINDPMVSGKHATILFRANKYIIKDELSAHGTFVNNEDIGVEAFELQDGDYIKMGESFLKFKSSL